MLIDGEKWACKACVRGHRVSKCQHRDRSLQHINKKGRPVSRCQHCRAIRIKCNHHKPTYKHAKASQNQLNRVSSMANASSLRNRSVDDLYNAGSSADSTSATSGSSSGSSEGITQAQRRSKSEATPPLLEASSSFAQLNGQLPPLDSVLVAVLIRHHWYIQEAFAAERCG